MKRSLFLPAAILLSFADLLLRGRGAISVVDANLPVPRVSSGIRVVDLVHPTAAPGRLYDVTFGGLSSPPGGARLQMQLASYGRTRILAVRPGHPPTSWTRIASDVLRGHAALRIVADREWLDLGSLQAGPDRFEAQVLGFLPGSFGFAELNEAPRDPAASVAILRPDGPNLPILNKAPRWRIVVPHAATVSESFARFFFFFSASRVLVLAGFIALALLFAGTLLLARDRIFPAVCCLVFSVTLLHAVCLPPLQGADETSHAATIEALVFRSTVPKASDPYPRSFTLIAGALQQDRIQYQPGEPLPVEGQHERQMLRQLLEADLRSEASEEGVEAPASAVQSADRRAALFFRAFRPMAPLLRRLCVLDRISAYRLISSLWGLAFFCAGALVLRRAGVSDQVTALYGIVALLPYSVSTVASCSNYAPAIGLGAFLSATALVIVLAEERRVKLRTLLLFLAGSWVGIFLWTDFIFVAAIGMLVAVCAGISQLLRRMGLSPAAARAVSTLACLLLAALAILLAARLFSSHPLDFPVPRELTKVGPKTFVFMAATTLAPFLAAAALAFLVLHLSRKKGADVGRTLRLASLSLGGVLLAGFLAVRWTDIPYEKVRLSFPRLVEAFLRSFLSTNLAWDQDRLSWKFTWGTFGWHDAFYPDWLYAAARWGCVALFVAMPVLCAAFLAKRPRATVALLLVSGAALSCCVVTETLRYLAPGNPFGRFILPLVPLAVLPVLVSIEAPGRERVLRLALAAGVALHVWTAIAVLGGRYCFGN